jgi:23S rRNA G2069 N7-methylase RlmK/C1962 C5-methylase RlmI
MNVRSRLLTAAFLVALATIYAWPQPASARSSERRNYAEEWRQEEREEERREERERARREWQEHQEEQQKRYIEHQQRQLDTVIDHHERTGHWGMHDPAPAAPAPKKKTGTCIYGEGNKVLYQPEGVACDRH